MTIYCSVCGDTGHGGNNNHCSLCHVTISSLSMWDRHRKGKKCLHPSELGLHQNVRGIWVSDYKGPSS